MFQTSITKSIPLTQFNVNHKTCDCFLSFLPVISGIRMEVSLNAEVGTEETDDIRVVISTK